MEATANRLYDGDSVSGDAVKRRRTKVIGYLNEAGFKPTLKGYQMLVELILLSVDEPELSCNELFDKYAYGTNGDQGYRAANKKIWWTMYRDCRYALKTSKKGSTAVYSFIRTCALRLEVEDEE